MIYEFCARTDRGLHRANNEDSVVFDTAAGLAVLADGMGGYNAGEVASGMATAFIQAEMVRWLAQAGRRANMREVRRALEICVENANQAILGASLANPQYAGMGTTLVVGVFQNARLTLGHIGDSRCYRLRNGSFEQITRDHSWLQEQVDAGLLTQQQAASSINRNLVTRALGVEDVALLEINDYAVEAGDLYLMCSDGLSDMVSDEDIARILAADGTLEQKATQLIDAANAQGGRDNISALLTKAKAGSGKRGLMARLLGA
ncbi:Stp1/IreP family PP2C-type Ser/Thr phosphatase [Ramlibacter sp. H39-3-26]|uniref:Stp1/IreP family PP2C-type Ser/Thr phosphatase n=1 Tax=Curvibacter soli TaxID=3031331 RepID=UPI0023DB8999|nr:Stp1/IreP family PP2C-type Ser/Thr phosphatase [Ramlibacter sp. H39-3-26]MDF1485201.1 Stp1/IreP family PP2C-type Ser/Thr phosphatase [Ramlibacter sp. H39-3-26]